MASYILISSQYRNRLTYPNPADFVIPFGTINNPNVSYQNVFATTNPVAYSLPDYNFCWTNFKTSSDPKRYLVNIISGTASSPIVERRINQELLGIYAGGDAPPFSLLQTVNNCYGILAGFNLITNPDTPNSQVRNIIDYDPTTCQITLKSPLPDFDVSNGPIRVAIVNQSENCVCDCCGKPPCPGSVLLDLEKIIAINGPFLDASSTVYFDYQVYLYNITLNQVRLVQQYQRELQTMKLCELFDCDWKPTDQYWIISRTPPMTVGKVIPFCNGSYYNHSFLDVIEFVEGGRGYTEGVVADLVTNGRHTGVQIIISKTGAHGNIQHFEYHKVTSTPFESGQMVIIQCECNMSACFIVRSTSLVFLGRLETSPSVFINPKDFTGNYFVSVLASDQYSYNINKNTVHVSPNNTIPVRNTQNTPIDLLQSQNKWGATGIKRVSVLSDGTILFYVQPYYPQILKRFDLIQKRLQSGDPLPPFFTGCLNFMVCQFSYEGVVPLNFSGSQITQSQMSCYQLTVTNLVLPNLIVNNSQGLLTSAYPYVFLEIANETLPSAHNRSIIYSNNPNSTRATFVCSISDVNNPQTTRFIKISSDGAVQTMKFSPFDNLKFRISLPNGDTFTTEKTDTYVPSDPDPRLQISAVLEIRKL